MEEIWKDIPGFEGLYQASNIGNIKSVERTVMFGKNQRTVKQAILHPFKKDNGYLVVKLYKDHKQYTVYVHRIIAMIYCDGYSEEMDVNHKDGIKDNNIYSNLEWCTRAENVRHSISVLKNKIGNFTKGRKFQKPIIQLSLTGEKIREWNSAYEVQRILGISESAIRRCLYSSKRKSEGNYQSNGYKWVYAKDYGNPT